MVPGRWPRGPDFESLRLPINMTFLALLPRIVITLLITLAIINLLIGVLLRYVVSAITNYMDWDPVPFTWVEEVGEMALAAFSHVR